MPNNQILDYGLQKLWTRLPGETTIQWWKRLIDFTDQLSMVEVDLIGFVYMKIIVSEPGDPQSIKTQIVELGDHLSEYQINMACIYDHNNDKTITVFILFDNESEMIQTKLLIDFGENQVTIHC